MEFHLLISLDLPVSTPLGTTRKM